MKPTTSTLIVTLWLTAACGPSESESDPESGSTQAEPGSAGTGGDTTGSSGDPEPASSTTMAATNDDTSTGSSTGGFLGECAPPGLETLLDCPDDLPMLGVAGSLSVDSFETEWTAFDENCGLSLTPPLYFALPDDIISFSLVVEAETQPVAFAGAVNGGALLIDALAEGPTGLGQPPLRHLPGSTANLSLPMSPDSFPTPGCLAVLPIVDGDSTGGTVLVHVATRRGDPFAATGELTLNAVRVDGVQISNEQIDAALIIADNLYFNNNAGTLADITVVDLSTDDGTYIPTEGPELDRLRSAPIGGPVSAINVFFIDDFSDAAGVLGIAAGIPGPNAVQETVGSGVVIALDSHRTADGEIDTTLMGETIAHEIGHQLGLFHTTESDGSSHDIVSDTAECTVDMDTNRDGQLAAEECPDGQNVMFWTSGSFSQDFMSPAQSDVIFYSPVSQ